MSDDKKKPAFQLRPMGGKWQVVDTRSDTVWRTLDEREDAVKWLHDATDDPKRKKN